MTTEVLVRSYGLGIFLIGSGYNPLRAQRNGEQIVYVFPAEAADRILDYTVARSALFAVVARLEREEMAR